MAVELTGGQKRGKLLSPESESFYQPGSALHPFISGLPDSGKPIEKLCVMHGAGHCKSSLKSIFFVAFSRS